MNYKTNVKTANNKFVFQDNPGEPAPEHDPHGRGTVHVPPRADPSCPQVRLLARQQTTGTANWR